MNNPDLYAKSNPFQVRDASYVLKTYQKSLNEASSEDVILDIGCGTGDVTRDILAPACNKYKRLVAVDLCRDMIEYASKHNQKENMHYEVLDIAGDVSDFAKDWGGFSKIFSFYCLHWIQDQKAALRNINKLMLKDAQCLLVFVAQCPVFEMYERMAINPRWTPYMQDVHQFVPSTQHMAQPAFSFNLMMEDVGFSNTNCTTLHRSFAFSSTTMLRDCVAAVSPFIKRIPTNEKEEYLNQCLNVLALLNAAERKANENESCCFTYKLMVAHGSKP